MEVPSRTMRDYVRRLRDRLGGQELLQVPSVSIALRDAAGRVLLARHADVERWLLPGGAIEPGESPADAAVREMWEETGLVVRLTGLVGVFGGPEFIVQYRNGHRTSYVMTVFEAQAEAGHPHPDEAELIELRFVSEAEWESLSLSTRVPEVLRALFDGQRARFRAPVWTAPHSR
jgi:8-oxo-dGTP pyrophosphatase MutT (NUDIX family)